MSNKFIYQTSPFVVPTDDGKSIREHFGLASINEEKYSVAHMVAPPGWSEPYQTPRFDEVTFVFRGRKRIMIDEKDEVIVNAGESILIRKGCRVQYSNPFDEEVEYVAICVPAFSMDGVRRE